MNLFDLFKPVKKLMRAESRNGENASTELRVNIEECQPRPFERRETKGVSKRRRADAGIDRELARRAAVGKITFTATENLTYNLTKH